MDSTFYLFTFSWFSYFTQLENKQCTKQILNMHKMTIMKSMIFLSRSVNVMQIQVRCKHSKVMRKPLQKFKPVSKWESQHNNDYEEEIIEPKVIPVKKDEIKADFLPRGMKMSDLPNFDRILGWDVKNPTLRCFKNYKFKTLHFFILFAFLLQAFEERNWSMQRSKRVQQNSCRRQTIDHRCHKCWILSQNLSLFSLEPLGKCSS